MATNTFAPTGLSVARSRFGGAETYMGIQRAIKVGLASTPTIGMGDMVKLGAGALQGYVTLSLINDTQSLGVFGGVLPYYDNTFQSIQHGQNGAYLNTLNPAADIPCVVYGDDPGLTFVAQCSGGTFAQSWVGQNINWLTGTNGVPNLAGRSTLALDFTTLGTSPTLPFRIVGVSGVSGGPQDPANVNPWLEVALNTTFALYTTGV